MANVVSEYYLKADSRGRVTLRSSKYTHWHAVVFDDGRIMLEPRVMRAPETISVRTLMEMDEAMRQMIGSNVGDEFDLRDVQDLIHEQ